MVMIANKLFLTALFIFCLNVAYSQADTVYIRYEKSDENAKICYHRNKKDSLNAEFPFLESVIYSFDPEDKKFQLFFSDNPLDTEAQPFDYLLVDSAYLSNKTWITNKWIRDTSFNTLIEYFDNKVLMLCDSTQPIGQDVYIVRVYFYFEGEE